MNVKGKVHFIGSVEQVTDKFKKQLIVVNNGGQFNNLAPIYFTQDKCAQLGGINIGDEVEVFINVGGREYNGKYYADVTGWKIEVLTASAPQPNEPKGNGAEDDLTF